MASPYFFEALPETEVLEEVETAIWYAQYGGGITQTQAGDVLAQVLDENGDKEMEFRFVTKWEKEGRKLGRIEGREEGRVEGQQEGRVQAGKELALLQLQKKLGKLNKKQVGQINALSAAQLIELSLALLDFQQVKDLTAWLKRQTAPAVPQPKDEN